MLSHLAESFVLRWPEGRCRSCGRGRKQISDSAVSLHSIIPHTQLSFLPVLQGILWSHLLALAQLILPAELRGWFVKSQVSSNLLQLKKSSFARRCPCYPCSAEQRALTLCVHAPRAAPCPHCHLPASPTCFANLMWSIPKCDSCWKLSHSAHKEINTFFPGAPLTRGHLSPQSCLMLDTNGFRCCKKRGF